MQSTNSQSRIISNLIYASYGNVPSRWAHSLQMQHMARAFAQTGLNVDLLVQISLTERLLWSSSRLNAKVVGGKQDDENPNNGKNGHYKLRNIITTLRSNRDADGYFPGKYYPRFINLATRHCINSRPDVVFTRSRRIAVPLIKAGVPTIVECHDKMREPEPSNSDLFELNLLKDNPNYLGMVTISDVLKESYLKNGYREEQVLVWPDAVDLRPFDKAISIFKKQTSSTNGKFRVGYCGQLYDWKGIGILIEAARCLPDIEFEIVGGNPEDVERWRASSQDLSNLVFQGYVSHEQIPATLMKFDAVCLPNLSNCKDRDWMSPLKLYEYMGAARAIVASDLPAIRKVLQHEQNALLCPPDSPSALVDALVRLKNEPTLHRHISQTARKQVESKSWNARAHDILEWVNLTPKSSP